MMKFGDFNKYNLSLILRVGESLNGLLNMKIDMA